MKDELSKPKRPRRSIQADVRTQGSSGSSARFHVDPPADGQPLVVQLSIQAIGEVGREPPPQEGDGVAMMQRPGRPTPPTIPGTTQDDQIALSEYLRLLRPRPCRALLNRALHATNTPRSTSAPSRALTLASGRCQGTMISRRVRWMSCTTSS